MSSGFGWSALASGFSRNRTSARRQRRAGERQRRTAASGACATRSGGTASGPTPRPFPGAPVPPTATTPTPTPDPATPAPPAVPSPEHADASPFGALVDTALRFLGVPYRNGGANPAGFDCSGFVQYVFAQLGIAMPREVREQYRVGDEIELPDVEPGDLVFFQTVSRGASHVGLAIGRDQFVHAPSSRGVVRVERYTARYWASRFVGARRVAHPARQTR